MKRILLVEDDKKYASTLKGILEETGYMVAVRYTAFEAMELLAFEDFDLIISDLYMDKIDGIQFLSYVKKTKPYSKTMILTGSPSTDSEVQSIDLYIDKYIVKETRMDLLLKYVALLLEQTNEPREIIELRDDKEDVIVNLKSRVVRSDGKEITLSPKKYAILVYLLQHRGEAVSREELLENIWDTAWENIDIHVIDTHIKDIRRQLKVNAISTVRGYGYKWEA